MEGHLLFWGRCPFFIGNALKIINMRDYYGNNDRVFHRVFHIGFARCYGKKRRICGKVASLILSIIIFILFCISKSIFFFFFFFIFICISYFCYFAIWQK